MTGSRVGAVDSGGLEGWPNHLRGAKFNAPPKVKKGRKYRRNGNTFGPASPCISHSAEKREEWARENASVLSLSRVSDRRRRPPVLDGSVGSEASESVSLNDNVKDALAPVIGFRLSPPREKEEWIKFVAAKPYQLDLGMCFHAPNALRQAEKGWDDRWLQLLLTKFFAELDRRVFGGASCRRHTNRLVVLQSADGVGWHAHVQIMTPKRFSQVELAELAKEVWLAVVGGKNTGPFQRPLFWSEPVADGHLPYMLTKLDTNKVDEQNTRLT